MSRKKNQVVPQIRAQTIPAIVLRIAGQLPWSHIKIILSKIKSQKEAFFYIHETIENGWSRDVLALQIESNLADLSDLDAKVKGAYHE